MRSWTVHTRTKKGLLRPGFEPGSVTFEFRFNEISLKRVPLTRGHYAFPLNSEGLLPTGTKAGLHHRSNLLVSEYVLRCESNVRGLHGVPSGVYREFDCLFCNL